MDGCGPFKYLFFIFFTSAWRNLWRQSRSERVSSSNWLFKLCLATRALHLMCIHSCWESSQMHGKCTKTDELPDAWCTDSSSVLFLHMLAPTQQHTQMNSTEYRQGVWHGQRWTHAGIRASPWFTFHSFNCSLYSFLIDTPLPPLLVASRTPVCLKNLAISNGFGTKMWLFSSL